MVRVAVLVSGGGTNLQALIDAEARGEFPGGKLSLVLSSKPGVFALERGARAGIPCAVISRKDYASAAAFSQALGQYLQKEKIDLIVLAGFLSIITESLIGAFPNRILNVHPALLPAFGGKGFYGLHVHEKALERGVKLTGATVHFVNEVCDGGPIVLQKAVAVQGDDTPERLQRRVMEEAEWEILPKAVALFCAGALTVENEKVKITEGN